ncbi:dipeptidyl peptidase 8-like [Artemia franciscana]|uniref:dipeptidyl peptidase 8-like n=1 Tax=Artemia franciscana TaxID=6661 RepID=UPI0032DBC5CF
MTGTLDKMNDKKTWTELKKLVKDSKKQIAALSARVPANVTFRKIDDNKIRIYFLSSQSNGRESTIFYADLLQNTLHSSGKLQWNLLIDFHQLSNSKAGKEEQLQWERKRILHTGIIFYDFNELSNRFLFPAGGTIYACEDSAEVGSYAIPAEIPSQNMHRINCTISPSNPNLMAYVSRGDIWVTHLLTGAEYRLTHSNQQTGDIRQDTLSSGFPSYVMQEEFSRYEGFWWQPKQDTDGIYRIVYEETDESLVDIITLVAPGGRNCETEQSRFPGVGTANAKSRLRLLSFQLNDNYEICSIVISDLAQSFDVLFPNMEYLVRVGWTPEGKYIYSILLDRSQKRADLVAIALESFCSSETIPEVYVSMPTAYILHTLTHKYWVSIHDCLYLWPVDDSKNFRFIWASQDLGYRHLFYVHTRPEKMGGISNGCDTGLRCTKLHEFVQLTNGEWEVKDHAFHVYSEKGLVFFSANKDTPLEQHYYVTSLSEPGSVKRLTKAGYSHTTYISKDTRYLATVFSNTQSMPACEIFDIVIDGNLVENVRVVSRAYLLEPSVPDSGFSMTPEIFSCQIKSGETIYGAIIRPTGRIPGKKYPTLVSVYGGPEVQLVTNSFMCKWQPRMNALVACGYNVVAIDSRGSANRGIDFEAPIYQRMGSVEIQDQVEVLEWLASREDCIDMTRVGIYGWSYGGYLSLMGLAQAPQIFKVAIAGAPVTDWLLYDTGYTERYMGLHTTETMTAYHRSSVLSFADRFPDEEGRLLIVHGMIDENVHFANTAKLVEALVKAGKPHQLQIYPKERHSMRHLESGDHFETLMLNFLHKNL